MMAALTAAQGGASVALLERNPKLGRKLYITGKGRCNVTNHCSVQEVLDSTPRNSRFLYGAMTRTPPAWVEDFFRQEGVPLKVERGNRVFPESDRAARSPTGRRTSSTPCSMSSAAAGCGSYRTGPGTSLWRTVRCAAWLGSRESTTVRR